MTFWIMLPLGIVIAIFIILMIGMTDHIQEAWKIEEREKRDERSNRRH